MRKFKDLTGQKFNRLTLLEYIGKSYWRCICDCGKIKDIRLGHLLAGGTKSCGCLKIENALFMASKYSTHNMSDTRFYNIWRNIKQRCGNENNTHYNNYGGRGINVCDRWLNFTAFKDDMYETYLQHIEKHGENNTTIDRVNNSGNYEPDNCGWATRKEQSTNMRKNKAFKAISPSGKEYTSNNQRGFAREHDLQATGIGKCLNKTRKHHKDWRFEYV